MWPTNSYSVRVVVAQRRTTCAVAKSRAGRAMTGSHESGAEDVSGRHVGSAMRSMSAIRVHMLGHRRGFLGLPYVGTGEDKSPIGVSTTARYTLAGS